MAAGGNQVDRDQHWQYKPRPLKLMGMFAHMDSQISPPAPSAIPYLGVSVHVVALPLGIYSPGIVGYLAILLGWLERRGWRCLHKYS